MPVKVLDAGCGTGLLGEHLRKQEGVPSGEALQLTGLDLSQEMLDEAKKKGAYQRFVPGNLLEPLPFEEASFDQILSSGCFLDGHVDHRAIPHIMRVLKPGGFFITTVREKMYNESRAEFKETIESSGCYLAEAKYMPYFGPVNCYVLVISKGWFVSDWHERCQKVASVDEQKHIYAEWAASYDAELAANGSVMSQSVTAVALDRWGRASGASATAAMPVKVLDAGCGTGLLGEHLRKQEGVPSGEALQLTGLDLSQEMLDEAKKKGAYQRFVPGNLLEPLPFEEASFDQILSSGCFLDGHVDHRAIPHIMRVLKPGGFFITTVREKMYNELRAEFKEAIESSGCDLVEAKYMPYFGPVNCYVLVIARLDRGQKRSIGAEPTDSKRRA